MSMKCERAVDLLTLSADSCTAEERRLAAEHAMACADCRSAVTAVHALRAEGLTAVPPPRAGAFERVVAAVASESLPEERSSRTFWSGMGLGAALAAGIAIAIVSFAPWPGPQPIDASATPQIAIAANGRQDVSISLTSPEALMDAEIRIALSGAIELNGFAGQRELRWRADLDQGANQLTLPVIAKGSGGGQLLVEVLHGEKRRTFLVDVRTVG
jgi:hypothetical protein